MPWRGWVVLRQHPEFFKLWCGQAISSFGSAITTVALPLTAVVVLHASPVQMGVLLASTTLPHLLFGLVAGVWVDRLPRRSILVGADVARSLLLGTIPVLGVIGALRIEHLYAVAFLTGTQLLPCRRGSDLWRAPCRAHSSFSTSRATFTCRPHS